MIKITTVDDVNLFASSIGVRSLAFLIGELDDSGTHLTSMAVAAGVMISDIERWPEIENKWNDVLKHYGIKTFHSADYDSCWGEFRGWNPDKKIEFMQQLTNVVDTHECTAFAYGNYRPIFDEAIKNCPQEKDFDLYSLCVEMCVEYVLGHFKIGESGSNLVMTIPNKPRYRGELLSHWQDQEPSFKLTLSSDAVSVRHQIADLVAREYYKYVDKLSANVRDHGESIKSMLIFRKSFNALLKKYASPFVSVDSNLERILEKRSAILSSG